MVDNFPKKNEIRQDNGKVTHGSLDIPFQDMKDLSGLINELRFENRYILNNEHATFLDKYIQYAKSSKVDEIPKGTIFYRARINVLGKKDKCFPLDEMRAPLPHQTSQGRVNPIGIPYLYLASNIDTAVSEVRPWKNCEITVAEFAMEKEISVANFSNKVSVTTTGDEQYKKLEDIWRELITPLFSMPFDPRDDTAYIPIQYISERIKREGLGGIIYDSALHEDKDKDSYNLCLFDVYAAKPLKGFKVTVNSMGTIKNNVEEI